MSALSNAIYGALLKPLWKSVMPLEKPTNSLNVSPGDAVRVRHKVIVGQRSWFSEVTGIVRGVEPVVTGLHTERFEKQDVWVQSLLLEKQDGELTQIAFDEFTEVELVRSAETE